MIVMQDVSVMYIIQLLIKSILGSASIVFKRFQALASKEYHLRNIRPEQDFNFDSLSFSMRISPEKLIISADESLFKFRVIFRRLIRLNQIVARYFYEQKFFSIFEKATKIWFHSR